MSNFNRKICYLCSKTFKKNNSISLHKFPSDIKMRSLWLKECGLSDKEFNPNLSICSKHFKRDSFQSFSKKVLKTNATPSRFTRNKQTKELPKNNDFNKLVTSVPSHLDNNSLSCSSTTINLNTSELIKGDKSIMINIRHCIESSTVPIVFNNMLDDWEFFKWNLEKWNNIFENKPLNCRKGQITCTKEPLWENKCTNENNLFSEIIESSKNVNDNGTWLYFDYKYIGEKIDEKIFQSISWKKFGYENLGPKDSTLWMGSIGAHTPCHQDLYGINLVAQVYGKKRWILMPPEMGKYLKPSRVPYEESSCYSKINFSCPDNIKDIDDACKCVSIILSPGDVLFVPHKWWHYVENLTTAISINTWIPTPKFDNIARLSESVVRLMVSSICSGVSEDIQLRLLNPNEIFSSSMTKESIHFIQESIKMLENKKNITDLPKPSNNSFSKYQFKTYQPEQSLCEVKYDSKYHRIHHSLNSSKVDVNIDFSQKLLNAFCNETVINQIVQNLIH